MSTIYLIEGTLHVKRVNERTLDRLLTDLANLFHDKAISTPYTDRYKILDGDIEVDGEDDSNPDDIVPLISGDIDFWCESYDGVRNDVYYIFKDVDGITCELWGWVEP